MDFLVQSLPCLGQERATVGDFLEARVRQEWPTFYQHYDIRSLGDDAIRVKELNLDKHGKPLPHLLAVATYVYDNSSSPRLLRSESRANYDPITFMALHREAACNGSYMIHGLHGMGLLKPAPAYADLAVMAMNEDLAPAAAPGKAQKPIVLVPPLAVRLDQGPPPESDAQPAGMTEEKRRSTLKISRSSIEGRPDGTLTERDAIDLALASGVEHSFTSSAGLGVVHVRDVHSPQDSRQCRAYAVVEDDVPSDGVWPAETTTVAGE